MKTRIIVSAVLLPIFFCVLFIFPAYILTIIMSAICAIAAYELLCATKTNNNKRVLVYTITAATLIPMAVYLSMLPASTPNPLSTLILTTLLLSIFFILICLLLIEIALTFKSTKKPEKKINLRHILISLAAGMLIPYLLSSLVSLKTMPYGHLLVLLPIVSAFMTDSGAYFIGVAIGKRKAFPTISPNKTVEGCIGGIITGTLGMVIFGAIIANTTQLNVIIPAITIYGILGAIVTELGDLAFSFIKRKCEIKDYGRLIPGHGGILDRFDSMTLTAPTMYLLVTIIPAIFV